ncbi:MAG TPA: hypothetical protein VNB52_07135, partial [Ilumatobacteraceae bacterium]|nr:hypothetical protein [Ilumatobacteraceae bacterium]
NCLRERLDAPRFYTREQIRDLVKARDNSACRRPSRSHPRSGNGKFSIIECAVLCLPRRNHFFKAPRCELSTRCIG